MAEEEGPNEAQNILGESVRESLEGVTSKASAHQGTAFFAEMPDVERDTIFELTARFRLACRSFREGVLKVAPINLGIGAYVDRNGNTPIMQTVADVLPKVAEEKIAGETETGGLYLPILGHGPFVTGTENLVFGDTFAQELRDSSRLMSAQSLGGTGACFLQGSVLSRGGAKTIHVSDPTWGNHLKIYGMVGLEIGKYPFFDAKASAVRFDEMKAFLETLAPGSPVSLHACCHNPTGAQLSESQWDELVELFQRGGLIAAFDAAYAGFGESFDSDMAGVRAFAQGGVPSLLAFSYSKIASLYDERIGCMSIVLPKSGSAIAAELRERVKGNLEASIRASYSNPPATFARVMGRILNDPTLRSSWENERQIIADEIFEGGASLAKALETRGVPTGNLHQRGGMFSMLPFSSEMVRELEQEHKLFMLGNGRINRGAVKDSNLEAIANRMAEVYQKFTSV